MSKIYVYENETGQQVDSHKGLDNAENEQWFLVTYNMNDYQYSYIDVEKIDVDG